MGEFRERGRGLRERERDMGGGGVRERMWGLRERGF